jgi:glutathione synthase/RimK-type ligase-like ATP-grasp enzyme
MSTPMPRVALITDRERPKLTHDDRLLVPALAARGITATPVIWDDPDLDFARWDALIVRSPWDYHRRFDAFTAWMDAAEAARARLWNPVSTLRWNTRKAYLEELTDLGAPGIPTVRLAAGQPASLRELARERDWPEMVVKAEVSGGGAFTWHVTADRIDAVQAELDVELPRRSFLVQPFLAGVSAGEVSLVFVDRIYSHAVLKQPAKGSFLVHEEHGGTLRQHRPDPAWITAAQRILGLVDGDLLYARVDLIGTAAGPVLVELELVEPELFVRFDAAAPARFATAVSRRLR